MDHLTSAPSKRVWKNGNQYQLVFASCFSCLERKGMLIDFYTRNELKRKKKPPAICRGLVALKLKGS
jgi:hypothetical protein